MSLLQIEYALLVAFFSVLVAMYYSQKAALRTQSRDDRQAGAVLATMEAQIKHICLGVDEIRFDLRSVREDMKEYHERLVRVEAVADNAQKRIEKIERGENAWQNK